MTTQWTKITKELKWSRDVPELDLKLVLSLETAEVNYEPKKCYILRIYHADNELINFSHYIGDGFDNLKSKYPAKVFKTALSAQNKVDINIEKNHQCLWYYTVGNLEAKTIIAQLGSYGIVGSEKKLIQYLGRSKFVSEQLANLEKLKGLLVTEREKYAREYAIWDSLSEKYNRPDKKIFTGNETHTEMIRSGWTRGGMVVSGSDYRDDYVYSPPMRTGQDEYNTYEVPTYKTVANPDYIQSPSRQTLRSIEEEYDTVLGQLRLSVRRFDSELF